MKFIELFAGIGGFRYGLEACNRQQQENTALKGCERNITCQGKQSEQPQEWWNYSCVWANEWDKYASSIYRYQFRDNNLYEGDIRAVDPSIIPDHDLIVGGFPCQSFSIAGKRGGFEDTRGTLFFEICRIARAKRTPYLLLENVKGLLSAPYTLGTEYWSDGDFDPKTGELSEQGRARHSIIKGTGGYVFQTILYTLDELGYDCQWQVLNSKNFGVPQNRERVFIIGHLREISRPQVFPIRDSEKQNNELQERPITGAITSKRCLSNADGDYIVESIRQTQRGITRHGFTDIANALDANYTKGQSANSQCERTMIHTAYPGEVREYSEVSPTISTPSGGGHLPMVAQSLQTDGQLRQGTSWGTDKPQSSRNIRRLTPIECERLQGFPDNWTQKGIDKNGKESMISDSQRYKCCGNAVTTNVITAIGNSFINAVV